jgi:hypothetical protein
MFSKRVGILVEKGGVTNLSKEPRKKNVRESLIDFFEKLIFTDTNLKNLVQREMLV